VCPLPSAGPQPVILNRGSAVEELLLGLGRLGEAKRSMRGNSRGSFVVCATQDDNIGHDNSERLCQEIVLTAHSRLLAWRRFFGVRGKSHGRQVV
jgi:hypothetical protein